MDIVAIVADLSEGCLAAAAAGWSAVTLRASGEQAGTGAAWLNEVPGKSRCFFDCPQHADGFGLLHILNYLGPTAGQAGVAELLLRSRTRVEHRDGLQRRDVGEVRDWRDPRPQGRQRQALHAGMCSPARPRPTGT